MAKKKSTFWSDFKAFINRGNVVDMAVGVVIGGAFGKIVTGLVNYIINPCVSLLTGGADLDSLKTVLVEGQEATETTAAVAEVAILWGTWFQTILDFLLVALCIFTVLRVMMRAKTHWEDIRLADEKAAAEAAAKEAAEKAAQEQAQAEAAAKAVADRQKAVEDAILRQQELMAELVEAVKKK